jgi:MFS family permease
MASGRVWGLAFVYLTGAFALYAVNFWMPTLVQELGGGKSGFLKVGLITMVPWALAGVAMVLVGQHSDRTGERRWHVSGSLFATTFGLALLAYTGRAPLPSLVAMSIVTCGVMSFIATFWAVPTSFLRGSAAACGIAWINSVGNLGGYLGPDLIGRVRMAAGSTSAAFLTLALIALAGGTVLLLLTRTARARVHEAVSVA